MSSPLPLALASTIRHDGTGGVADDLADLAGFAAWLDEHADELRRCGGLPDATTTPSDERTAPDEQTWREVLALRRAVRSLFARAVRPDPPSRADPGSLLDPEVAVDQLNLAAGRLPVRPVLRWPDDAAPTVRHESDPTDPGLRLTAALARAAIEFLCGPYRERLRACPAPRCVRYFIKDHPRQEWCKPSCGNRARVARHYHRHQPGDAGV